MGEPQPPWDPYGQQGQQPYPDAQYGPPGPQQPQGPYQQQPGWPQQGQPPHIPPGTQPPYPGPGYGQPQPPGRGSNSHWVRNILAGIGALVVASVVISHFSGTTTAPAAASPSSGTTAAAPGPLASGAAASAAGSAGSSFELQDQSGDTYRVSLVKVIDPAQSDNQYIAPDSGTRFVGAVFTIKALSGAPQDEDANDCAAATGSNGQSYSAQFYGITGYTNFDNGTLHITQGETVTGAVVFQVPAGVKVSKVQWTSGDGYGSTAQWNIGS